MTILPAVVKAEYRGDYRIHLTFNDGTAKIVDFQPWLEGPIFEPLRDQRHFREFFVAGSAGRMVRTLRLRRSTPPPIFARWHNSTFDRTAGSLSLAAAGQRERSPYRRQNRAVRC